METPTITISLDDPDIRRAIADLIDQHRKDYQAIPREEIARALFRCLEFEIEDMLNDLVEVAAKSSHYRPKEIDFRFASQTEAEAAAAQRAELLDDLQYVAFWPSPFRPDKPWSVLNAEEVEAHRDVITQSQA